MEVSKSKANILNKTFIKLHKTGKISDAEFERLNSSYTIRSFDWKRLAKYSFLISIFCIIILLIFALNLSSSTDLFAKIFNSSDLGKLILLIIVATVLYIIGIRRKSKYSNKIYSNEAIFFLGAVVTEFAFIYIVELLDISYKGMVAITLLKSLIYGLLGLWFPSKLIWILSLLLLSSWFQSVFGYGADRDAYFLGMNHVLRFGVFGLFLIFGSTFLFIKLKNRDDFLKISRGFGLFYVFVVLWIMTIFGNYDMIGNWWDIDIDVNLYDWSILLFIISLISLYHGLRYDDEVTRGFGLIFIFINLYTKYFELFWHDTPKLIFFGILALSFWLIGLKAESIWQLVPVKKLVKNERDI